MNEIKRQRDLATNTSNTYVSITEDTVLDMNDNPVVSLNETNALRVSEFIYDTTDPRLDRFDLNLTSEILTLTFSETVRVDTIDVTQITIQNLFSNLPDMYWSLRNGEVLTEDSTEVLIRLNNTDLNEIKIRTSVATMENNSYISFSNRLLQDMNTNWNTPIPTSMPFQVSEFTEDDINPELERFVLDMDGSGVLTLYFSESVNTSSLDPEQITLLMAPGSTTLVHTFTSATYTNSTNGPIVEVFPSLYDLNRIKMIAALASSMLTSYISITSQTIVDMNDNTVNGIPSLNALLASGFVRDDTNPTLDEFSLDLNEGLLILTFSETVIEDTLNRTKFTLQSTSNFTGTYLVLENTPVTGLSFHYVLTVPLLISELNEIKRITSLAVDFGSTWLSVEMEGVFDTFDNRLVEIPRTDAIPVSNLTADTTDPELIDFDIDLNAGTLTLIFDETVRASSLNVTQITLQDTPSNDSLNTYTLTNSVGSSDDSICNHYFSIIL